MTEVAKEKSEQAKGQEVFPVEDAARVKGSKPPGVLGFRHFQALLLSIGLSCAYSLRVNISVAIVAMVNKNDTSKNYQTFDWTSSTQSLILSSFFWGYVITQVPAGQIAARYGGRRILSIALGLCGIVALLNPLAANLGGWQALCACRLLMGLCQGAVYPSIHTLLAKWAPLLERGSIGTFVYAGNQFGTVIAMPISGLLSGLSVGWPSVFYLFGGITIVWSIVFFIFGADSPAVDPRISAEERDYIEMSLKAAGGKKERPPMPWKAVATSPPMWALLIVHATQTWGYWMLLTEIPTYLSGVLGFAIKENGSISALPYLAMWILSFPVSFIADYVLKRGYVSVGASRKICNSIGHWIPAMSLAAFGYIENEHQALAVAVLVITVGSNAGTLCGYQINHMDLSPNFAGTMMGITNGVSSVLAILAPLITGLVVTDSTDITQWRTMFFATSVLYILGNLWFVLFGSGEVQWWNDPANCKPTADKTSISTKEKSKDIKDSEKY